MKTNAKRINPEDLERTEDRTQLIYNGQAVASRKIDWGWTSFYATPQGDGWGTIRNTGFAYYTSADAFRKVAQEAGE